MEDIDVDQELFNKCYVCMTDVELKEVYEKCFCCGTKVFKRDLPLKCLNCWGQTWPIPVPEFWPEVLKDGR